MGGYDYMKWYLLIVNKDLDTEFSVFYRSVNALKKAVNIYGKRETNLDVMVYEGDMTDRMRNYLMTIDPFTLKDKGY